MVPNYLLTVLGSHRESPSREKQEFYEVTRLKGWNSSQESTILN